MNCPNCNAPIDADTIFCGNCGFKLSPQYAPGVTVSEPTQQVSISERTSYAPHGGNSPLPPTIHSGGVTPESSYPSYIKGPGQQGLAPSQTPPAQPGSFFPQQSQGKSPEERRRTQRTFFLVGILVVLVLAASGALVALLQNLKPPTNTGAKATTTTGAAAAPTSYAQAFFSSSAAASNVTDTVKLTTFNLAAPASSSQYDAWLIDNNTERVNSLGTLQAGSNGSFTLAYTDPHHQNLLSLGSELRITLDNKGPVSGLSGSTVLTATMPEGAFTHIRHLLYRFNTTPHNVGLLVGMHDQVSLVFAEANSLKAANDQNNQAAVQCYAQSIIDIVEGNHGAHAKALDPTCSTFVTSTGDGFGLLDSSNNGSSGYIALASAHAGFAATTPDTTPTIKTHAGHVQICLANIAGWMKDIDSDSQSILANNNVGQQISELVQRADHALNGVDLNNDESIDPVTGEGGATTAYNHGQLMAQLHLTPKAQ